MNRFAQLTKCFFACLIQNLEEVNAFQLELMKEIEVNKMPLHRSELYLSILQLYREIINRYTVIVLLQRELNFMLSGKTRGRACS